MRSSLPLHLQATEAAPNPESIDVARTFSLIWRYRSQLLWSCILCGCVALGVAALLPKQFKSRAVVSIQASYFQAPMVNELVSAVADPRELQAQRLNLLRMALTDEFLDRLGERFGIFQSPAHDVARVRERELFRERIELFAASPTSFQIGAIGDSPTHARALTLEILDHMMETVVLERYRALLGTHQAIEQHVAALEEQLRRSESPEVAKRTSELRDQLRAAEAQLQSLLTKFTERHPSVVKQRQRLALLQQKVKGQEDEPPRSKEASSTPPLDPLAVAPTKHVFEELKKKLSYLEVVLEMEKNYANVPYLSIVERPTTPTSALFPKRRIFFAVGCGIGLLLGLLLMIMLEMRRASSLSPRLAATRLGVPLLGELPELSEADVVALPAPSAGRHRLPSVPPSTQE